MATFRRAPRLHEKRRLSQRVGGSVAAVHATGRGHREEVSAAAFLALAGRGRQRVSRGSATSIFLLTTVSCEGDGDIVNRVMAEAAVAMIGADGDG